MTEIVQFPTFITKGITVESGDERRIFKGHITAEIIDRQQEFIFVKEVMKIMETFMSVNPVLSDYHSNRMVGKVLAYEQSEYQGVPTVLITGEVYKKEGVTLYDKIWDKVVKGEYAGLSMGGASKEREPIMKDGKMALELRKLELYEIALCDTPANPFAVIESVNTFAKAVGLDQGMIKEHQGREQIRCTTLNCWFEKGTNIDDDVDINNHEYKCTGGDKCDTCGLSKAEHGMEQFNKPIKGHDWDYWDDKLKDEYPDKETRSKVIGAMEAGTINKQVESIIEREHELLGEKPDKKEKEVHEELRDEFGKLDNSTLVGRSAQTRSDNVGQATGSPKETNDIITSIPKVPTKIPSPIKKDISTSTTAEKEPETQKKEMEEGIKDTKKEETVPETVEKMIERFGVKTVEKALEDIKTMEYLKKLYQKYR